MHSSTHHAGMPLNHMVANGTEKYWTYKQKGIRRMKPFVEEYFKLAPKDKDYNVKGYLVNSDGGMVHVGRNNEVTFYKDMKPQQKKKADNFKKFSEKIMNKPKDSKPAEGKEQTKPRVNPNDFYQKVYFPKRFNFLNWDPAVVSYFIKRNKNNEQFYFKEIEQDIKNQMPKAAVKWFENRRKHLLEMQKKTNGAHAQPQPQKKKPSAVSTDLDADEIKKMKDQVEKIPIIKLLHDTIIEMNKPEKNNKWPTEHPDKLKELLSSFFLQYTEKSGLFQDRDDNVVIRNKLQIFQEIFQNSVGYIGDDEPLKALSCYLHGAPSSFDEIKTFGGVTISLMTKNLILSLQQLKGKLFQILLAYEKKKMQKMKEARRVHNAAASLNLSRDATEDEVENAAVERLNSSDTGNLSHVAFFYALNHFFHQIPLTANNKNSFDLPNMSILAIILKNYPNMYLNFFHQCFTINPYCNECLNQIKKTAKNFHVVNQEGDIVDPANP